MSKRPNISKEAQVLLKLLRIALGTEPRKYFGEVVEPFPDNIDWKEVVRLSYEHKVSAIAVDGLEASKYDPYQGLDEKQTEELKAVLVPWIKDVENTEWSYCYYVEVLKTLCQIFRDNGLTPIILKGYGLSLNYPRPSHRGAGDIDLFLVDKDGRPAQGKGNYILESVLGAEVHDPEKISTHHSAFTFKGIDIENHCELSRAIHDKEYEHNLVKTLKDLLLDKPVQDNTIEGACHPSADCNAVFLIRHMFRHFYFSGFTIRQMCDWMMYLKCHYAEIDWDKINTILMDSGMKSFADALHWSMVKYLGMSEAIVPQLQKNDSFADRIIQVALCTPPTDTFISRFLFYYRNRWKIKYSTGEHWIKPMCRTIFAHLKHPAKYPLFKR